MSRALILLMVLFTTSAALAKNGRGKVKVNPEEVERIARAEKHYEIGKGLYETDQYAQACTEFEKAIKIRSRPIFYKSLAWCYVKIGKQADAAQNFRNYAAEISETEPVESDAVRNLGDAIDALPTLATPAVIRQTAVQLLQIAARQRTTNPHHAQEIENLARDLLAAATQSEGQAGHTTTHSTASVTAPPAAPVQPSPPPRVTEKPVLVAVPDPPREERAPLSVVATPAGGREMMPVVPRVITPEPVKDSTAPKTVTSPPRTRKQKLRLAGGVLIGIGGAALLSAGGLQLDVWLQRVPEVSASCSANCLMDQRIPGIRNEYNVSWAVGIGGVTSVVIGSLLVALAH